MRKRVLIVLVTILCAAASVNIVSAQDTQAKDEGMGDMAMMREMHKSSHHKATMAFRQNIVNLAKALSEMAKDENNFDKDIARIAILEIEHGIEKIDEIHRRHLATVTEDMRMKMEVKAEKNLEKETALTEHYCELEMILQAESLDLKAFAEHANAIAAHFEKM